LKEDKLVTSSNKEALPVDLDYVREHFNPIDQRLVNDGPMGSGPYWTAIDLMLEHCPVTHSDGRWFGAPEGAWVVNDYDDIMAVIQDPETFSNRVRKGLDPDEPPQILFDTDPPLLLEYRRLLQPHLSLKSVARFEQQARAIANELIDSFIDSGRCENFASQFSYKFSTRIQWAGLVGVREEDADHEQLLDWMLTIIHKRFEPEFAEAHRSWIAWIRNLVAERRAGERRDDLIDGLLHSEVEGHPLTDDEITRVLMSLILGGVTATADAITAVLFWISSQPELQDRLRADKSLIPQAIEEILRVEPPAISAPRRCTRDAVVGGHEIKAGQQLMLHYAAANRDPSRFEHPHDIDLDRRRTAHLSFGAGHHRCLGSNFARLMLRLVTETCLERMEGIRVTPGEESHRIAGVGWMIDRFPMSFTPAGQSA
jgi:cytochrome P450